jgi:adenylate cyclase class 2
MALEVEQKYPVEDLAAIEAQLRGMGASIGREIEQADYYFNHPVRDFAATDEALRIRRVGNRNRITFKGPKIEAESKTRQEIELPLGDGNQQAEQWSELLKALGFTAVAVVRKRRKEAKLAWQDAQVEIALDQVDDVGRYVELELSAEVADFEAARSRIAALAQALGLSGQERRSYLELLLGRSDA